LCDLPSQVGVYHAENVHAAGPSTFVITFPAGCNHLVYKQLAPKWLVLVQFPVCGIPGALRNNEFRAPERAICSVRMPMFAGSSSFRGTWTWLNGSTGNCHIGENV
jgi:hypothetical protein